ncbi:CACTA en-spm transposon protein [Cucumis melo var. makuwa]|uniref:CACTA en-spm transposon protein n=1 Tax=Cucumis melo var. makuwa TaxID=1194695 RepID=A0A5D3DEQ4_CUCMM|nr:CACTA en-spm transposon protein [Cucumis melo var. makuwa]
MFREFSDELNNTRVSSSMGNNSAKTTQSSPTPRRRQQSRLFELERYVHNNGRIPMAIASKRRSQYLYMMFDSTKLLACVRRIFPVWCLRPLRMRIIKYWNSSLSLPQKAILNHSLGTRCTRPFWIYDRGTQKRKYEDVEVMIEQQIVELEEAKRMIEEQRKTSEMLTSQMEEMKKMVEKMHQAQRGP